MARSHTILAVDDNDINLGVIQEVVEDRYHLMTAKSGEEALALAMEHRPDVILLDIMMPGIDGIETCRRIRALPELVGSKVVMLSAKPYLPDRLESYAAGADDYLTKPVDEDELLAKLRVFMKLKSAEEIDEIKTTLLTVLDHEIRTPLTGILPSVEMLCADGEMEESERKLWAETARENAQRLVSLAERSLLLCRLEQEHADVHIEPVDLVAELRTILEARGDAAPQIRLEADGARQIAADRGLMREFLACLIEGMNRYSDGEVVFRFFSQESDLRVEVDSCKLAAEHSDPTELLEPLGICRVDGEVVGSDIALPLACSIARAHGVDLLLQMAEGGGMSLRVAFPYPSEVVISDDS